MRLRVTLPVCSRYNSLSSNLLVTLLIKGPSELRTLSQNLNSNQFQSPLPSPSPGLGMRREADLCSIWLQTGACSAALRGLCSMAHSLNELSSPRPTPHRNIFDVSIYFMKGFIFWLYYMYSGNSSTSTQSLQRRPHHFQNISIRGGTFCTREEASEDGYVCELQQLGTLW